LGSSASNLETAKSAGAATNPTLGETSNAAPTVDQTSGQTATANSDSPTMPLVPGQTNPTASPPRDAIPGTSQHGQAAQNPRTPPIAQKKTPATLGNAGTKATPALQPGASGQVQAAKPNHIMKQQQQNALHGSPGSNLQHKTSSTYSDPGQQQQQQQNPPSTRPPFAGGPSRPMGNALRNESTGSLASRRSTSCDFDPLGPFAQDLQSDDGDRSVMSNPSVQLYSTPLYMMESQPVGQMGQAMMFTSQAPMMQVSTHQSVDPSTGMAAQGFQQPQNGSMLLVPPQVSFLEQPTLNGTSGHDMVQPQMMMTFQQPAFEQQHGQWVQQQQQQQFNPPQPMTPPHYYSSTQQQMEAPLHQDSNGSMASQNAATTNSGPSVDPFEALVQQRRPSNAPGT